MRRRRIGFSFWVASAIAVACGGRTPLVSGVADDGGSSAFGGFTSARGGQGSARGGSQQAGAAALGGTSPRGGFTGAGGLSARGGSTANGAVGGIPEFGGAAGAFAAGAAGAAGAGMAGAGGNCDQLKLVSVIPPNAKNDVAIADTVNVTFSCPPDPAEVSSNSLRLSGNFVGHLSVGFSGSADSRRVSLLPLTPDSMHIVPFYRPGELVTGWVGAELGGPFIWQYRAAVRHGSSGQFQDSGQALDSGMDVELGDLDYDGDLDAITSGAHGTASVVWENDGTGQFTPRSLLAAATTRSRLVDLDGDGDLDIASASIFINQRDFSFQEAAVLGTPVAVGDFDGDGDQDVITSASSGLEPWLLQLNDGSAHFSTTVIEGANAALYDLQTGDLDGDGTLDLVALVIDGSPATERGAVMLNDGHGLFKEVGSFGTDATRSLALGDLDSDGDLDIFAGSWGAAGARNPVDQVWLNDGLAHFSAGDAPFAGSVEIVLGDLDGDGDLDAVAGSHDPYSVTPGQPSVLLWNDGNAHFTANGQLGGNNLQHVRLGDLDGDGDLDAVVAQWDWFKDPPVQVWLQGD